MWHFIMTMTDDKMTLRDIGNKHRVHWVLNLYNIILIYCYYFYWSKLLELNVILSFVIVIFVFVLSTLFWLVLIVFIATINTCNYSH